MAAGLIVLVTASCGQATETSRLSSAAKGATPEPLPPDVTSGHAYVVDLCDDDQASRALDGGDLENDRRRVGAACGPNPPKHGIRYVGWFEGAQPLYTVGSREKAIAEVRAANKKYALASRTPGPEDYFASPRPGGACESHGLTDLRRWAEDMSSVLGDFDGDGKSDRFIEYATGPESYGGFEERLRMEFATGLVAEISFHGWEGWGATTIGTGDINSDGRDEAWVGMHGNSANGMAGLVVFEHCDPTPVSFIAYGHKDDRLDTNAAGGPPPIDVYGVECPQPGGAWQVVQTYQQEEWHQEPMKGTPEPWNPPSSDATWNYTAYRLDGSTLRAVASDKGTGKGPDQLSWESGLDDGCVQTRAKARS